MLIQNSVNESLPFLLVTLMAIGAMAIFSMFAMVGIGLVEVAFEMFKHRDFKGVRYFDQPPAYDISSHFERFRPRIIPKSTPQESGFDRESMISLVR